MDRKQLLNDLVDEIKKRIYTEYCKQVFKLDAMKKVKNERAVTIIEAYQAGLQKTLTLINESTDYYDNILLFSDIEKMINN